MYIYIYIYIYIYVCMYVYVFLGVSSSRKKNLCEKKNGWATAQFKLYCELVSLAWNCIAIGKLYCNLRSVVGLVLYCKRRV